MPPTVAFMLVGTTAGRHLVAQLHRIESGGAQFHVPCDPLTADIAVMRDRVYAIATSPRTTGYVAGVLAGDGTLRPFDLDRARSAVGIAAGGELVAFTSSSGLTVLSTAGEVVFTADLDEPPGRPAICGDSVITFGGGQWRSHFGQHAGFEGHVALPENWSDVRPVGGPRGELALWCVAGRPDHTTRHATAVIDLSSPTPTALIEGVAPIGWSDDGSLALAAWGRRRFNLSLSLPPFSEQTFFGAALGVALHAGAIIG